MMWRAFTIILSLASVFLAIGLLQERYLHMKTKRTLAEVKAQLSECHAKLELQNALIESMKADYDKKLREFKKQKPKIEKVYEPLKIEVPTTTDECQALKEMLSKYKEVERSLP